MLFSKEKTYLLNYFLSTLREEKDCVFLNTQRIDKKNYRSFLFIRPKVVVRADRSDEVVPALKRIEDFINKGFYAAGYLNYEAGLFLEDTGIKNKKFDFPLLWFGIYTRPLIFNHRTLKFSGDAGHLKLLKKNAHLGKPYKITNPEFSLGPRLYSECIKKIKKYIEIGDTYQVNFTFKYKFDFHGSAQKLFLDLNSKQSVSYAAFVKHNLLEILSFSPELFFRKKNSRITVKPMKGTISRGLNIEGDELKKALLDHSQKDRAENIMIVDLLRSDLGRISQTGTVKPIRIFEVEKYETLFQMTSSVKSRLKKDITLIQFFRSLFPSGSVTGAPKIKTMQIIEKLEREPRKVYTGSIGFISPYNKEAVFNVAIRTILIDKRRNRGEMGIGSGVIYDSQAPAEYAECKLKANFLVEEKLDFALIETILWKGNFFLLPLHLKRLHNSAEYFNFKFDKKKIIKALRQLAGQLKRKKAYRLRLLLQKNGNIKIKTAILKPEKNKIIKVTFSKKKVNSRNPFIYHKTTNRNMLDEEYSKSNKKGFDEIVFTNEKGQITEGAISNIIIKKNGFFYTPPVSCGLLNGVFRQFLLQRKKIPLKEKVLYRKDLLEASHIYFINSVRGMRKVSLLKEKLT